MRLVADALIRSRQLEPDICVRLYTKIAQRIPVKIVFDDHALDRRLRPGMSATVSVWTAP